MRHLINISLSLIIATSLFIGISAHVYGSPGGMPVTTESGILLCGGNNGGALRTIWTLRNFDNKNSINIDRIRIYGANGTAIVDVPWSEVPPSNNFNPLPTPDYAAVIGPNQTFLFASDKLEMEFPALASVSALENRPLQFLVVWSAGKKTLDLDGVTIIEKNLSTGTARTANKCRMVK